MTDNVKSKTIKGTFWSMVERFSTMGIQLLCTLVMAQFLSPEEFGLIGMMSIFLAFSNILIDAGFSQAVIRERNVTQLDYCSIFHFNIFLGLLLYGVFFFVSPLIAGFYGQPRLILLIRVSFLSMLIFSTSIVQQARLLKAVDFAKISKVSLVSVIISGIVGIAAAVYTHSVWALIAQSVSFALLRSIMLWIISNWRPQMHFSIVSINKYIGFSLNLLGTNIIAAITDNLPNLFIGKCYSASVLGNYTIPDKLQRSVAGTISLSIHRVSYPVMATFQDDDTHLRDYSQKVVGMAFFVISPIMMFLWIESNDLFDLLLPSDWNHAADYFRYMCIIGAVYCFADINLDILMVKGKSSWVFRIEIVRKIIFVGSLLLGITYDIDTLLQILIAYNVFNALFVSYFSGRIIGLSLGRQLLNQTNTIIALVVTTVTTAYLFTVIDLAPLFRFSALMVIYIAMYLLTAKITRNPYINEILTVIPKFRNH